MSTPLQIRPIEPADQTAWTPLWDGYNAFYGRHGETALDPAITATTWQRFFDPDEPVFALVAECDGRLVGLVHFLFHRSTTRIEPVCYLQDLFTAASERGRGIGGGEITHRLLRAADFLRRGHHAHGIGGVDHGDEREFAGAALGREPGEQRGDHREQRAPHEDRDDAARSAHRIEQHPPRRDRGHHQDEQEQPQWLVEPQVHACTRAFIGRCLSLARSATARAWFACVRCNAGTHDARGRGVRAEHCAARSRARPRSRPDELPR